MKQTKVTEPSEAPKADATLDDLVDQVGNLTNATTELLNATNIGKGTLDEAVDEAKGHAQSAETSNKSAVNAKEEAKTAATEAKAAEDNAVAIVHNDEGSLTPKAGAYALADSKGHLDIGWTPLLQAMYPYSGVIGSVDKLDIFHFAQASSVDSNRFSVRGNSVLRANINGRFVEVPNTVITLPPAESTADRAIAFDDIFINWDGEVTTYRSITPHRTTTGYDRDLIATEHGYTKVNTGLYKTGETYALLLGRVARRNQGAYHPVYNPEGTPSIWRDGHTSGGKWWGGTLEVTSIDNCFDNSAKGFTNFEWGKFYNTNTSLKGRPNTESFDAIYADDFTPLYYSAKNVIDRQALLFDSFNRAVSGETFSGAEGVEVHPKGSFRSYIYSDTSIALYLSERTIFETHYDRSEIVANVKNDGFVAFEYKGVVHTGSLYDGQIASNVQIKAITPVIDMTDLNIGENIIYDFRFLYFPAKPTAPSARPQFLMTDIIGSLESMPEEWKTEGIPGNWLAVGEEGESLIPDGTNKNFKLSRKCLECYQVLGTNDNGATWSDATSEWKTSVESSNNARQYIQSADTAVMIFYRTAANPFELADNTTFIALSRIPVAINGCRSSTNGHFNFGALTERMISKVPVATSASYVRSMDSPGLSHVSRGSNDKGQESLGNTTEHLPFMGTPIGAVNPCAKHINVLVGTSYRLWLQIVYQEMKHNTTQWGDDNKFNIVDKQSTATDLNGEKVIVGQKRVELPYHFDGEQY